MGRTLAHLARYALIPILCSFVQGLLKYRRPCTVRIFKALILNILKNKSVQGVSHFCRPCTPGTAARLAAESKAFGGFRSPSAHFNPSQHHHRHRCAITRCRRVPPALRAAGGQPPLKPSFCCGEPAVPLRSNAGGFRGSVPPVKKVGGPAASSSVSCRRLRRGVWGGAPLEKAGFQGSRRLSSIKKAPAESAEALLERRRLPTFPHGIAVSSAQVSLTSQFGMV